MPGSGIRAKRRERRSRTRRKTPAAGSGLGCVGSSVALPSGAWIPNRRFVGERRAA
jgi:hypothetical protein